MNGVDHFTGIAFLIHGEQVAPPDDESRRIASPFLIEIAGDHTIGESAPLPGATPSPGIGRFDHDFIHRLQRSRTRQVKPQGLSLPGHLRGHPPFKP